MPSASSQSISDVRIDVPELARVIEVLTLQAGFNSAIVVIGTTLLGIAAGTIGTFALLRNRSLMGDALAHSALPGLAAAFILGSYAGIGGRHLWLLLLGATISGVLGVLCVQWLSRSTRLHEDSAIGAVLSCFFGAGVVLMSIIQSLGTGEEGGLHHFIFGQTAAMNRADAYLTLFVAVLALAICAILFKEFRVVSFDQDFAASEGWPVSRIDLAMMSLVVVVTVVGLQAVGLLLIVALLIIPPAGARFWTEKLKAMMVGSALIGGLSGYLGSAASALLPRLPAGAVIVLIAGVIFFISFLFAPARGVLSRFIAQIRMTLRIAEDHVLRELYEQSEKEIVNAQSQGKFCGTKHMPIFGGWSKLYRAFVIKRMAQRGLVEVKRDGSETSLRLLPRGLSEALRRVRNHRLWEEYLISEMDLPCSHVDYSADYVEHVLSPDIVSALEKSLARRLAGLGATQLPESVHPLSKEA